MRGASLCAGGEWAFLPGEERRQASRHSPLIAALTGAVDEGWRALSSLSPRARSWHNGGQWESSPTAAGGPSRAGPFLLGLFSSGQRGASAGTLPPSPTLYPPCVHPTCTAACVTPPSSVLTYACTRTQTHCQGPVTCAQRTRPAPGRLVRPPLAALRPRSGLVALSPLPCIAASDRARAQPPQVEDIESGGVSRRFLACSWMVRAGHEWGFSSRLAGSTLRGYIAFDVCSVSCQFCCEQLQHP